MQRGFTLIETLITIAIGTIIIGIGGLYVTGYNSVRRTQTQAEQLVAVLKVAQANAMSQQSGSRWGVFVANPTGGTPFYQLYEVNEALVGGGSEAPGEVVETHTLPASTIIIAPAPDAFANVIFSKSTGLPSTSIQIILQTGNDTSQRLTVTVDANGRIQY